MTKQPTTFTDTILHWCEQQIIRFPWTLLVLSFLLCGGVSYHVYKHLGINTNTAEMLDPNLPFQQNQRRIDKAFPQDAATLILIVEAGTPEETTLAANKLQDKLSVQTDRFDSVYIPTDNAFSGNKHCFI